MTGDWVESKAIIRATENTFYWRLTKLTSEISELESDRYKALRPLCTHKDELCQSYRCLTRRARICCSFALQLVFIFATNLVKFA